MSSKKLILSGILPIFILGSITHFAYDWCSTILLALHIYNHYSGKKIYFNLCVVVLIFVVLLFVIFTFNPPHIPIFKDYYTGTYGIYYRR